MTPADHTERWRLEIAYDGREFSGWASQPGLRTVQGVLEEWISRVLRLSDPVALTCAGRTDAGVHARGQVAHLDVPVGTESPELLARRLARVLPEDLVVRGVRPAPPGFDARFAAIWRRYVYRINDGLRPPDPLSRGMVARVRGPLHEAAMQEAGQDLLGLHDFAAFCKWREGATTIRTLQEVTVCRHDDGTLAITVRADAFCHNMVRSLVGALTAVGSERRDGAWLRGLLQARTRDSSVPVLPSAGLCLEEIGYPADADLAARVRQARNTRESLDLRDTGSPARRDTRSLARSDTRSPERSHTRSPEMTEDRSAR